MEMPDVMTLCDYWADNPPAHLSLKAVLGLKDRKKQGMPALTEFEKHIARQPAAPSRELPDYVVAAIKESALAS